MSNSFSLDTLTEGIRQRHLGSQNKTLVEKWSRTGLLRGLDGTARENMSRLLENQASQVLREASSVGVGGGTLTQSGDLRGFTNIAFPIVRRVFGGLVANDLVSIQPMSLPSGLLFYLDYTYGQDGGVAGSTGEGASYASGSSIYNTPSGAGVRLGSNAVGGQYDLAGSGFSKTYGLYDGIDDNKVTLNVAGAPFGQFPLSGAFGNTGARVTAGSVAVATGSDAKLLQFDPQIINEIEGTVNPGGANGPAVYSFLAIKAANLTNFDGTMIKDVSVTSQRDVAAASVLKPIKSTIQGGAGIFNVRRLNQLGTLRDGIFTPNPLASTAAESTVVLTVVSGVLAGGGEPEKLQINFPQGSVLQSDANSADTLVIPAFESNFGVDPSPSIPEIDIKVEAVPVVAETRKLRARWSPELAQDLNAYHSLDAEVELTQILSEQIALEIDREILNDLLTQAQAANFYWSRAPGKFVNKETGVEALASSSLAGGPSFRGTVREWYETLVETIIDVANQIHRKTLRGSANFIVVGPDVATILEASVFYKPSYSLDGDGQVSAPMVIGADRVGTLSNRFTVYKDPYFPRNKVLVGYKGGSYLETGYVYAPYVPLIVTPTIFAPEDFTPRKGVMTRYGKKMVRADFYGTVTCMDMSVI